MSDLEKLARPFARLGKGIRRFPPDAIFTLTPNGVVYWREVYDRADAIEVEDVTKFADTSSGGISEIARGDDE